ncbi:MAG: small acid-soluble spore protein SspI [bacterium]|nr:small acid-soluble spore protein SspI [bacterium]
MNIDIRKHIINNFKGDNKESIKNAIESSINEKDEVTLPGLGVFLEIIWQNSNDNIKEEILSILEQYVK